MAGVHVTVLTPYKDFSKGSHQYNWLKKDLERNFDRRVTPWLVVAFHAPWYNTAVAHYQVRTLPVTHLGSLHCGAQNRALRCCQMLWPEKPGAAGVPASLEGLPLVSAHSNTARSATWCWVSAGSAA